MQGFSRSALSLVGLVLLLGVMRSLGNKGVSLGRLAYSIGFGLRLGVDVLGAGLLLSGVRRRIDLGGSGGNIGDSGSIGGGGSIGLGLGLIVVLQLGAVDFGVLPEAILHCPAKIVSTGPSASKTIENILEFINTVDALGLFLGEDEAAERSLEVLSARPVGHASKTRAVPVDLAGLWVERSLLASLLLELLGVQTTFQISRLALLGLRGSSFFANLGSNGVEGLGVGIITILFPDRRKDRD